MELSVGGGYIYDYQSDYSVAQGILFYKTKKKARHFFYESFQTWILSYITNG